MVTCLLCFWGQASLSKEAQYVQALEDYESCRYYFVCGSSHNVIAKSESTIAIFCLKHTCQLHKFGWAISKIFHDFPWLLKVALYAMLGAWKCTRLSAVRDLKSFTQVVSNLQWYTSRRAAVCSKKGPIGSVTLSVSRPLADPRANLVYN